MRTFTRLAAVLLAGCAPDVRGGTAAQQELVRATIAAMEDATGHALALPAVALRDVKRGQGKYNAVTRRISLDTALSDEALVRALRHELCHALDLQIGFGSAGHPAWRIGHEALQYGSERRQAREAFAGTCEVAPTDNAVALACGTSDLDGEIDRMLTELFEPTARVPELIPEWTGQIALPEGEVMTYAGVTDLGNVWIHAGATASKTDLFGVEAPTGIGDTVLGWERADDALAGAWRFVGRPWRVDGVEVGLATRDLVDGSRLAQWMVSRDGAFEATACGTASDLWFAWDGEIWLVRQEGAVVRWGPLR